MNSMSHFHDFAETLGEMTREELEQLLMVLIGGAPGGGGVILSKVQGMAEEIMRGRGTGQNSKDKQDRLEGEVQRSEGEEEWLEEVRKGLRIQSQERERVNSNGRQLSCACSRGGLFSIGFLLGKVRQNCSTGIVLS